MISNVESSKFASSIRFKKIKQKNKIGELFFWRARARARARLFSRALAKQEHTRKSTPNLENKRANRLLPLRFPWVIVKNPYADEQLYDGSSAFRWVIVKNPNAVEDLRKHSIV